MNEKKMSVAGIGPAYVITITIFTVISFILAERGILPVVNVPVLVTIMKVLGIFFIIEGVIIWISAVFKSNIKDKIKNGKLVTDGVYGYVRNPIYAAFMIAEWGILLVVGSLLIIPAVPLYWILMSEMVKRTEEKWMTDKFDDNYKLYMLRVNRCIPWIKKH